MKLFVSLWFRGASFLAFFRVYCLLGENAVLQENKSNTVTLLILLLIITVLYLKKIHSNNILPTFQHMTPATASKNWEARSSKLHH